MNLRIGGNWALYPPLISHIKKDLLEEEEEKKQEVQAMGDYLERQKEQIKKEIRMQGFGAFDYIKQSSSKYKFGDEDREILQRFRRWSDLYLQ